MRPSRASSAAMIVGLTLACVPALLAQGAVVALQDSGASQEETVPTTRFVLHPTAPSQPALKHVLLVPWAERKPGNAALLYLMAAQLQESANADENDTRERIAELLDVPPDELPIEECRRLVGPGSPVARALNELRMAARRDRCDWQTPFREAPNVFGVLLPSLSPARHLARVLALHARLAIVEGDFEQALDDLQVGLTMARHIGEGETLIHRLVANAIAGLMVRQIQELVQCADAPNLYWPLSQLPRPLVDLNGAFDVERQFVDLQLQHIRAGADFDAESIGLQSLGVVEHIASVVYGYHMREPQPWRDAAPAAGLAIIAYPEAKAFWRDHGMTETEIDAMSPRELVCRYWWEDYCIKRDEMFKWLYLPYWQAERGMKQAEVVIATTSARWQNPLMWLLPSLARARLVMARQNRDVAALRVVEALRIYAAAHDGALPPTLADVVDTPIPMDPMHGRDFEYSLIDGVATLSSPPSTLGGPRDGMRYIIEIAK